MSHYQIWILARGPIKYMIIFKTSIYLHHEDDTHRFFCVWKFYGPSDVSGTQKTQISWQRCMSLVCHLYVTCMSFWYRYVFARGPIKYMLISEIFIYLHHNDDTHRFFCFWNFYGSIWCVCYSKNTNLMGNMYVICMSLVCHLYVIFSVPKVVSNIEFSMCSNFFVTGS